MLAAYFTGLDHPAGNIVVSPIHGLYERQILLALFSPSPAAFRDRHRPRRLAAGARPHDRGGFPCGVSGFITRASTPDGGCNEALGMALAIGSVMSFAGVLMASQAGRQPRFGSWPSS